MPDNARILIAGAGIGGLALAQALHHTGFDVAVYEQDPTPQIRNQGYRLHIDDNGNAALRTCLPPEVLDRVVRTSGISGDLVAVYTHQLQQVFAQEFPKVPEADITHVDRNTFRRGLLTGLDGIVHFGHSLTGYEITETGRVRVEFANGGTDEGDLLIGADGVGSAVRRRLLPHATVRDLGIRCLYGRMPITETTDPLIPPDFHRGFIWVADESGTGAGLAEVRFRTPVEGASHYMMATFVAPLERLAPTDAQLYGLSPEQLWKIVVEATADWHPAVHDLFTHSDPNTFFPITIRAGERLDAWQSGPVTLLGDAIHPMPPTGGVGANTALQDAATLAEELRAVARAEKSLSEAVADYETVMLPRGFDTIDSSLQMAEQLFGKKYQIPTVRTLTPRT